MTDSPDILSSIARPGEKSTSCSADWREAEQQHLARAEELLASHRARMSRGEKHPVWDFLFTYYSYRPSLLLRWHPGAGIVLEDAAERAEWRWYTSVGGVGDAAVDTEAFLRDRGAVARISLAMLRNVLGRAPRFGCFGLHEWAMVYRQKEHRHSAPLRLGPEETDAVVEAADIDCTHFDAYRFFTPEARPRNARTLERATQVELDQPGCLHAGMDVYKWAVKLGPLVPGALLLDAFELARDIRLLDMEAAPYDLSSWGVRPVRIETPEGRQEYGMRQRELSARAQALRSALLGALLSDEAASRAHR